MTENEKLIALKAMVGNSDSDEVLSTYLKLAGRKIIDRAFPYGSFCQATLRHAETGRGRLQPCMRLLLLPGKEQTIPEQPQACNERRVAGKIY